MSKIMRHSQQKTFGTMVQLWLPILRNFYLRNIDPRYSEYEKAYEEFLADKKRVLDVGCGVGHFIAFNPKYIEGVDHNITSLKIAKKFGYHVKRGEVTKLPFASNSFDGVFSGHVIEHVKPADALKMLYECDRVLKINGFLVLKSPLMYSRFFHDLTHVRPYPPECLMDYLMPTPQDSTQRTANQKARAKRAHYKIVHLSYRYDFVYYPTLEPSRIHSVMMRNIVLFAKICSMMLYRIGIKNYFVRTGYTLVLQKVK